MAKNAAVANTRLSAPGRKTEGTTSLVLFMAILISAVIGIAYGLALLAH